MNTYQPSNLRETATPTMFFIDSSGGLIDWLVVVKGMDKANINEVGRHWAVLNHAGMELVIDPPSSLGSASVKCYGTKKKELSDWIREYKALESEPLVRRVRESGVTA